jgi:hypothetical protein
MNKKTLNLERRTGTAFSHVVLYQTNPNNPLAVEQIIRNATKYLTSIPGIREFSVGPRFESERAVQGDNYDVAINFIFDSRDAMEDYMKHSNHRMFVEFVLNGLKLEDSLQSTVEERKLEFIDYVLNAKPEDKRNWAIDSEVPDSQRVWAGEQVYDFGR